MLDAERARELDAEHPPISSAFELPAGVVYLDGNSLGAMPSAVRQRLANLVDDEWRHGLIRSWNDADWIGLARRVGDRIAAIVGAPAGTVVACDSTSVNLYKAVASAMGDAEGPRVILTDTANFPSDLYVLQTLASTHGWAVMSVEPTAICDSLGAGVGVLAITQVDYRSGRRHEMASVNAAARTHGVVTVWDLAHSAGAFEVDLLAAGTDYAVGCGYKFLNGGPGAPGFIYVATDRQAGMFNPITGWFGHARPFDFDPEFQPASGIDRMRVGTSHVLSLTALDAALEVFGEVDQSMLWRRGAELVGLLLEGFTELGLETITPTDPEKRGSQAAFRHPDAYAIVQALIERNVIGDFRTPDVARFGVAPLYLSYTDIAIGLANLAAVLEMSDLSGYAVPRGTVT